MQIKGVLFDKDGTLLDFNSLWLSVAEQVAENLAGECCALNTGINLAKQKEKILWAMGVEHGIVRADGPLAYMTYEKIGKRISEVLTLEQIKLPEILEQGELNVLFEDALESDSLPIKATCNLRQLFMSLREKEIKLGLATADNKCVTERCLRQLGIIEYLDFIGCDDGVLQPKPQADMFVAFCQEQQLHPEEVAVIGDTYNDMLFAKKCGGLAVGVLCGLSERKQLEIKADIVVDTPENILDMIE